MSQLFKITVRTRLQGKRKVQFENLKRQREESDALLLREMIDFYFKNNPIKSES